MKKRRIALVLVLCLCFLVPALSARAQAADLDEILLYEITVDVNDDATLRMVYHIDWKVLDSTSEGPLNWVEIGLPNRHYSSLTALSDAVKKLSASGSYVRVDLDRDYYAGEVAPIEFLVEQDYMYQVDQLAQGETVYTFTPGWFDGIRVDELVIRWNGGQVLSQSPACTMDADGYYTWTTALGKGQHYTVSVTYPNDAFAFDLSKEAGPEEPEEEDDGMAILGGLLVLIFFVAIVAFIVSRIRAFTRTANFSESAGKKITRTRVEYYPECQGCGGPRPEGANNCPYCGRSFIKSEEVIQEDDIPREEKELRRKTTDGLYPYATVPNTFIRVHVTPVHVPHGGYHSYHSSSSGSHSSSSGGRSSSSRGSGSSCAHSSCACACACACAGGGRAGCSTKDFYNTDLKLRQLALRTKK